MRTDAEKQAFAMKCLEIEKQGGDVLGYIEVNWPSYSPRGTWYNLQRQYLNRNTNNLTEGKRKEESELRRDRKTMLNGVLKVLSEKGDPIAWLKEQGYANPNQAWTDLRAWANKHGLNQGRLPANLSTYYANLRRQESDEEPATVDLEEHPERVKEAVNRVFFGGKEYEKMDKPSPTCCQPAPPSGVTVPDELPEEPDGNQRVAAVAREMLEEIKTAKDAKPIYPIGEEEMVFSVKKMDSKLCVWEYNREKDLYIFQANFFDDRHLNVLALTIKDWLNLAAEIPKAIRKMTEIIE